MGGSSLSWVFPFGGAYAFLEEEKDGVDAVREAEAGAVAAGIDF